MENKHVGYFLLAVSIVIIIIVLMFDSALKEIVETSCGEVHSLVCPMNQSINQQTYLALSIVGIIIVLAIIMILTKKEIVIKKVKGRQIKKRVDLSQLELKTEERQVLDMVTENKAIFQADLIDKTGMGKAKITRILDHLESKGLIERKRRGMTNVVVLKE